MKNSLLATLADKNYLDQAKQLFASAYFNGGWQGDFMLLAHEIPTEDLQWFYDRNILVYQCRNLYSGKHNGKWPSLVLSKLYLFSEEFKQWQNIVFLDADIIVRAPLDELAAVKGFSAAQSHPKFSYLSLGWLHMKLEMIDGNLLKELQKTFDQKTPAFNSGVMAFNTGIIKTDTFQTLKDYAQRYFIASASGEELILNMYFYKQWERLPQAYNLYPDYVVPETGIAPSALQGIILHFVINKPWEPTSPFYQEWRFNLEKADIMDAKKIQTGTEKWSPEKILQYQKFLDSRRKKFPYVRVIRNASFGIDKMMGLCGLALKKYCPNFYYALKKFNAGQS